MEYFGGWLPFPERETEICRFLKEIPSLENFIYLNAL